MGNALDVVAGVPGIPGLPGAAAARIAWHRLSLVELQALRSRMLAKAPGTINKALSAIRGVLKACRRLGLLTRDELDNRIESLPSVKGKRLPRGRMIPVEEVRRLFEAAGQGPLGSRNRAILSIAAMGLRRDEIAKLPLDAYDANEGALRVIGKRNKERLVPLAAGAKAGLDAWLAVRGMEPGPLLVRCTPQGVPVKPYVGISKTAIYDAIVTIAKRAGVTVSLSPHDFRRTMISTVLDSGDVNAAKELAGHENVQTTLTYDRRGEKSKKAAVAKLDVPYEDK